MTPVIGSLNASRIRSTVSTLPTRASILSSRFLTSVRNTRRNMLSIE